MPYILLWIGIKGDFLILGFMACFRVLQEEARGSVVGAGRSPVQVPDKVVFSILPTALSPWGRLSSLREMSTRNLPGG
jgi:hypothetical protein